MGFALARTAMRRGAAVTLVTGPVALPAPPGVEVIRVQSAHEMAEAVFARAPPEPGACQGGRGGGFHGGGACRTQNKKERRGAVPAKILELVETASTKKAKTEKFITRFAQIYTPIVVALAVLLALLPTLVFHQPFSV